MYKNNGTGARIVHYIVLGFLIFTALFLAFIVIKDGYGFSWINIILFSLSLLALFFAYCWASEERWIKMNDSYKKILDPLAEDFGTSLFFIIPIIGVIFSVYEIIIGEDVSNYTITLIVMMAILIFDIIMVKIGVMEFNFIEKRKKKKKKLKK